MHSNISAEILAASAELKRFAKIQELYNINFESDIKRLNKRISLLRSADLVRQTSPLY